jgi:type 1 fimbria pilin
MKWNLLRERERESEMLRHLIKVITQGMAGIVLFVISWNAFAACTFETGSVYSTMQTVTIPLRINIISVPPDTPVGAIIYQQSTDVASPKMMTVNCKTAGTNIVYYDYISPGTPSAGFSNVYPTNVAGIGVRYSVNANNFPYSVPATSVAQVNNAFISSFQPAKLDVNISFIKTASAVSANIITASDLPQGMYSVGRSSTDKAPYFKFSLSGTLQVTTPTCNIAPASANMTVTLGEHHRSVFTGKGSGTPWKDASIVLINCPQFYGNSSTSVGTYTGGTTFSNPQSLTANSLEVKLTPLNGINSADSSIMNIDSGSGAAEGIGIQLSTSESSSGKINFNEKMKSTLPMGVTVGSLTIPLYARYIQTESSITAGVAKGRLEYIITYQ